MLKAETSSDTVAAPSSGKFYGIQYLRALCALLVVISHENGFLAFPQYFGRAPLPSLHIASLFAVAVFFSISGFIIAICGLGEGARPIAGRSAFLLRRAVRILPFFWLCTLVYNALSFFGAGRGDIPEIMRTLTLWPLGSLKPNVAWSLRHEAAFYLLFAFLLLGTKPRWGVLWLWVLAPIAAAPVIWDLGLLGKLDGEPGFELFKLFLAGGESGANVQFGAGLLIGIVYRKFPTVLGRVPNVGLLGMCGIFAMFGAVAQISDLPSGLARVVTWTLMSAILILFAIKVLHRSAMPNRVALALGNSSFSLYLMHNTVMLAMLFFTIKLKFLLWHGLWLLVLLVICVLVSIFACELIHRFGEIAMIKVGRRYFNQRYMIV